jgi:ribonuclease HI
MFELYFDGAFKNKIGSFGYVLYEDGKQIDYGYGIIGSGKYMTATVAEYYALSHGLDAFVRKTDKYAVLNIYGDSKFVIDCVNKELHEFSELQTISMKLKQIRQYARVNIEWIARSKNKVANDLAKKLRSVSDC